MDFLSDSATPDVPSNLGAIDESSIQSGLYQRSVADADNRDDSLYSKIAIAALGIKLFGNAIGRNLFADFAGSISKGVRFLENYSSSSLKSNISQFARRSLSSALDTKSAPSLVFKDTGARLDSIPFIQNVAEAVGLIHSPLAAPYSAEARQALNSYFAKTSDSGLTVGEVISNASKYFDVSEDAANASFEIKLLKKAVSENLISEKHVLDANVFLKDSVVKDTRLLRPAEALNTLSNIFNPFGLVSSIKSFVGSERKIGFLSPDLASKEHRIFIDGTVFAASKNKFDPIAFNKELGDVGDSRYIAAFLRENDQAKVTKVTGNQSLFDRAQDAIGVGPKFHEKQGGFFKSVLSFLKNVKAVNSGEASLYGRPYKYFHDSVYNRVFFNEFPEMALESGQEISKGLYSTQGLLSKEDLTPKTGIFKGFRGWLQRMKAYAGINPDVAIVKPGKVPKSKEDLFQHFGRSGIDTTEAAISRFPSGTPTGINVIGKPDFTLRANQYAASAHPIDKIYDFANYLIIRLNKLASASLLGIGFKPTGNLLTNTLKLSAIPMFYMASVEGAKYIDYAAGKLVGEKPSNLLADLYTNLRVKQQKVRENTGLTNFSNYIEKDLLPGVDSGILGTGASILAGISAIEKTGSVKKALGIAGAIYGAIGGPDPGQSSASLEREYSGEEKVPIRKSRWWMLGFQPFKGGQIDYYAPSWYVRAKQDPYTTNIYGSEDEYWKHGSLLPTPSNLFGLGILADPYAIERQNYYDRPYPKTGKLFEEVPIFGPLLADTIGEIIKPQKDMQISQQGYMVSASNISDRGVPTTAAKSLGIPDVPLTVTSLKRPDNFKDRIDKYANVALSPAGVWKFALETFGVTFDKGYKLADAGNMTSVSRSFYEKQLGGLFGETEFIRRFLLSDYGIPSNINQQINPIPNTMPRWLPGSLSENQQDRSYFTDFTRGDPYTKIPGGEFRLPGPGYESVNPLHSGISGVYSDVDKFLVLADIAPYSTAFYKYQSIVGKMDLSPYWQNKIQDALNRREEKAKIYDFYEPNSSQEMIANANRNIITKTVRGAWTTLATQTLENMPVLGAKIFPYRNAYEEYASSVVEGETFSDWKNPFNTIVRPAFYTTVGENPFIAAKRGLQMGFLMSSPMSSFLNPFPILKVNPVATTVAGASAGFLGSTVRWASTGSFEHGFVPPHVEDERNVSQYFDYLQYAKSRALESKALEEGNTKLAKVFNRQSKQTVAYGLEHYKQTGDLSAYMSSMPRAERPFFEAFLNAPMKDRNKILAIVPEHMREVLSQEYGGSRDSGPSESVDQQALDYFKEHGVPSDSWQGWSPSVPLAAIKIKAIQGGIGGISDEIHRFGLYPAQQIETNIRFPELESPDSNVVNTDESNIMLSLNSMLQRQGQFNRPSFKRTTNGTGPQINWFAGYLSDSRRNDVFAFYNDVYR